MKPGWHVFFADGERSFFSTAPTIEAAAGDYVPKERKKIVAIIREDAMSNPLPIASDVAFLAVKTKVWKREASR